MATQRKRHPKPYDGAFRRRVEERKRQWNRIRRALASTRVSAMSQLMFEALFGRALVHLNEDVVLVRVGYGGHKDAVHKAAVEARRAAGWPPRDGLAELTGRSRRSMIRAAHQLVAWGVLIRVRGGGSRGPGAVDRRGRSIEGLGVGGRGLANEYQLAGMPEPPAPPPPAEPPRPPGDWSRLGDIARSLPDPRRSRGP